jgi:predicted DNA-binding ribbon-helix-helix protein
MTDIFGPLEKHSVTVAGHPTSIRIESLFWEALCDSAVRSGLPVNALIAQIDAARLESATPPNLASAIRLWLFAQRGGFADIADQV